MHQVPAATDGDSMVETEVETEVATIATKTPISTPEKPIKEVEATEVAAVAAASTAVAVEDHEVAAAASKVVAVVATVVVMAAVTVVQAMEPCHLPQAITIMVVRVDGEPVAAAAAAAAVVAAVVAVAAATEHHPSLITQKVAATPRWATFAKTNLVQFFLRSQFLLTLPKTILQRINNNLNKTSQDHLVAKKLFTLQIWAQTQMSKL